MLHELLSSPRLAGHVRLAARLATNDDLESLSNGIASLLEEMAGLGGGAPFASPP